LSTDKNDIKRLQEEFANDVFEKKSGPNTWFEGSKITQVIFGTVERRDTQPYFYSLLDNIASKNGAGEDASSQHFTLVYSSDSQGFRIKSSKGGNIVDIFESSLVREDDEDDISGTTKVSSSTLLQSLTFKRSATSLISPQKSQTSSKFSDQRTSQEPKSSLRVPSRK
jgi:hypothetical protein